MRDSLKQINNIVIEMNMLENNMGMSMSETSICTISTIITTTTTTL